jgi:hypothetical protein
MVTESLQTVTLAVILGTLLAIVYSLRILVLLERRIARVDHHIELMTMAVLENEKKVLSEEQQIAQILQHKAVPAKTAKKASKKRPKRKSAKKSKKK